MAAKGDLRVLFIGAGAVNFGGAEGPWDHSRRLEKLGGVKIVAIADPLLTKARAVLEQKLSGKYAHMYKDCVVIGNYLEALSTTKPHVVFIGVPPAYHGNPKAPFDIELKCLKAGVHIFVEKPLSVVPPEQFQLYVEAVEKARKERNLILSVGYMFRYHPAIEQMQSILKSHGRKIIGINARYNCTYSASTHPFWWDKSRSGGPIVEQATHFCDLARYFGGNVRPDTISAVAVPASDDEESAGYLSAVQEVIKEKELPPENRIPRFTNAHWRFEAGGTGSLMHGLTLQGKKYEAHFDIWADGLRLALEQPYFPECKLRVRKGNESDEDEVYDFPDADPYLNEDRIFLEAVRTGDQSLIRSSFSDAAKTYKLSWDIRRASEQ